MKNLQDRLKKVIESKTPTRGRFKDLEELTALEIAAENWKNFWYGRQRPTLEMIEFVCQQWPEHAFWIATGLTDPENGHEMPGLSGRDLLITEQFGERTYAKELLREKALIRRILLQAIEDPHSEVSSIAEAQQKVPKGNLWRLYQLWNTADEERSVMNKMIKDGEKIE